MEQNTLPKNWVETELGKVVISVKGKKPKRLEEYEFDNSVPYLDIKALEFGEIRQYADIESSKQFQIDDIAIVWDGARSGWVAKPIAGAIGSTITAIKPQIFNSDYLYYYLLEKYPFINSCARGVGIPHVDPTVLWQLPLPLPPLAEQERIVKKLDALFAQLDGIREAMERIPQLLKDFRQQVLNQAVTGKLTEEWLEFNLNDLGKWVGGGTPSKNNSAYWSNGNIPWITPKDMKESFLGDSIDKITPIAVDNSSAILIPKNSVLVVMRSGILRRTLPVAMNIVETTVNQDLKAVILKDFINPVFFLYSLIAREADIRNQCIKSGTTVESIEFSLLKEYTIGVPPLQEQEEIVRRVDSLFRQADAIEEQYKSLKDKIDTLPQAILHKAFKGELVEQLPSDGDAHDLLRQIEELKKWNKKK